MAYQMNFSPVLARAPEFVDGAINTVVLTGESVVIGLTIGLLVAIGRVHGRPWMNVVGGSYVELFRNTPLLVQVFLFFFGLPYIGFRFTADTAAIVAISFNLGAYSAEIFRAGLLAIPRAQIEAGLALGMSLIQVIRHVVIVPALRIIFPALTGQLTLTLLGSSIVSAISAKELTSVTQKIESLTFRSLEAFIVALVIYIGLTFLFRTVYWLIGLWLFRRTPASRFDWTTVGRPQQARADA